MTAFLSWAFKATGATTARTMPDRLADYLNVKDFGALGNGSANDYSAIQACFDAAYGTAAAPHEDTNKYLNKAVYFPPGHYMIGTPLVLTRVWGGHIWGDSFMSTSIEYTGSISGSVITPVIEINGMRWSRFGGLRLINSTDVTNHLSACLQITADGALGGTSANGNTFYDLFTEGASQGITFFPAASSVSENVFLNCTGQNHEAYWFRNVGGNTLNQCIIGGGCSVCGEGISVPSGSVPNIIGPAFAENTSYDINISSVIPHSISGVRTESPNFIFSAAPTLIAGCAQSPINTSATIFVNTGSSGKLVLVGCSSDYGGLYGQNQGQISIFGCSFGISGSTNAALFSNFTGYVGAMPVPPWGGIATVETVALLPTPAECLKGVRAAVRDSTVAVVNNTNIGAVVAGTGSNTVPVWCDGTDWRIG